MHRLWKKMMTSAALTLAFGTLLGFMPQAQADDLERRPGQTSFLTQHPNFLLGPGIEVWDVAGSYSYNEGRSAVFGTGAQRVLYAAFDQGVAVYATGETGRLSFVETLHADGWSFDRLVLDQDHARLALIETQHDLGGGHRRNVTRMRWFDLADALHPRLVQTLQWPGTYRDAIVEQGYVLLATADHLDDNAAALDGHIRAVKLGATLRLVADLALQQPIVGGAALQRIRAETDAEPLRFAVAQFERTQDEETTSYQTSFLELQADAGRLVTRAVVPTKGVPAARDFVVPHGDQLWILSQALADADGFYVDSVPAAVVGDGQGETIRSQLLLSLPLNGSSPRPWTDGRSLFVALQGGENASLSIYVQDAASGQLRLHGSRALDAEDRIIPFQEGDRTAQLFLDRSNDGTVTTKLIDVRRGPDGLVDWMIWASDVPVDRIQQVEEGMAEADRQLVRAGDQIFLLYPIEAAAGGFAYRSVQLDLSKLAQGDPELTAGSVLPTVAELDGLAADPKTKHLYAREAARELLAFDPKFGVSVATQAPLAHTEIEPDVIHHDFVLGGGEPLGISVVRMGNGDEHSTELRASPGKVARARKEQTSFTLPLEGSPIEAYRVDAEHLLVLTTTEHENTAYLVALQPDSMQPFRVVDRDAWGDADESNHLETMITDAGRIFLRQDRALVELIVHGDELAIEPIDVTGCNRDDLYFQVLGNRLYATYEVETGTATADDMTIYRPYLVFLREHGDHVWRCERSINVPGEPVLLKDGLLVTEEANYARVNSDTSYWTRRDRLSVFQLGSDRATYTSGFAPSDISRASRIDDASLAFVRKTGKSELVVARLEKPGRLVFETAALGSDLYYPHVSATVPNADGPGRALIAVGDYSHLQLFRAERGKTPVPLLIQRQYEEGERSPLRTYVRAEAGATPVWTPELRALVFPLGDRGLLQILTSEEVRLTP